MSTTLHIKDAYYFEVPRALWKSERQARDEFPEHYVRLDPEYQDWEAKRQIEGLRDVDGLEGIPSEEKLLAEYHEWRHDHKNFAKPFDRFLEEAPSQEWFQRQLGLGRYADQLPGEEAEMFASRIEAGKNLRSAWDYVKEEAEDVEKFNAEAPAWSKEKIAEYNHELDGKIFIPQPFAKLQNNYNVESGFGISKFMILEVLVAALLVGLFWLLARRVKDGRPAKGRAWNMFEAFLMFIRDDIARPAIGHHDADRFVPLLWTMFMFVLGLNLLGMLPWMGAPTAAFAVTLSLAAVTFITVLIAGTIRFGVLGFWKNQVPSMGLPMALAIPIVPMVFAIEVLGLVIKHGVLGVRLLANMVAGHLVLLALMGLAVAAAASSTWWLTASISVVGSALFSLLELFVAFLQAYVFTFLSALFIGAAVHHH
jgi:F-type H+-transporting ATPase subunit a